MNNLYNYLRDNYAAYPLDLGSPQCTPGQLLKTEWLPIFPFAPPKPEFQGEKGYAWQVLSIDPGNKYDVALVDSAMTVENLTNQFQLGAETGLPQYGLKASTSIQSGVSVTWNMSGIKVKTFKDGSVVFDLLEKLRNLRKTDPARWDWIDKSLLITLAYYVTELTASFHTAGTTSAQASFQEANVEAGGGFNLTWLNDHEFKLVGAPDVPFAVRGERVVLA